jgi:hypothetical protein
MRAARRPARRAPRLRDRCRAPRARAAPAGSGTRASRPDAVRPSVSAIANSGASPSGGGNAARVTRNASHHRSSSGARGSGSGTPDAGAGFAFRGASVNWSWMACNRGRVGRSVDLHARDDHQSGTTAPAGGPTRSKKPRSGELPRRLPVSRRARSSQPVAASCVRARSLPLGVSESRLQRKPMWLMPVSIMCGRRAAGR